MSIADLRPDTARELNDQRFYGQQTRTLNYVQNLYDRLRARRPGNRLPADHPQRPAAEEASIAEMQRFGDRLSELAAEAWLPGVEPHDIDENTLLVDALRDLIEIDWSGEPGEPQEPLLLTEDIEIETTDVPFDLSLVCRVRISRDQFEGTAECRLDLDKSRNGHAVYSVALCD